MKGNLHVNWHFMPHIIVLLKNENQLLPLPKDKYKKIAVIGPCAGGTFGGYSGEPYKKISSCLMASGTRVGSHAELFSPRDARLRPIIHPARTKTGPTNQIIFQPGKRMRKYIHEAVEVKTSDIIILAIGEYEQISREAWSANHHGDAATLT